MPPMQAVLTNSLVALAARLRGMAIVRCLVCSNVTNVSRDSWHFFASEQLLRAASLTLGLSIKLVIVSIPAGLTDGGRKVAGAC
jgi:hypothetical protein